MPPWHSGNRFWQCLAICALLVSSTLLGCNNSSDNVAARDVENRTFIFDSSFIDSDLRGLTTTLAFELAANRNRIPFNLTFTDEATATDERTLSGTATITSIELPIGDEPIEIRGVTLPNPIVFDVNVDEEHDGTLVFTFTNEDGNRLLFEFEADNRRAQALPVGL